MLSAYAKSRHTGFSLVELMVGIAILGIVLSLALPSFKSWIQSTRIRTAAESIQDGLQKARAVAVTRNTKVSFVFGAGSSWVVRAVSSGEIIESRSGNEGSMDVTRAVSPVNATTVTFNSFGAVAANADATSTLAWVDLDSSRLTPADRKSLRVTIGAAGVGSNIRMCDPNLASGSSPRAC